MRVFKLFLFLSFACILMVSCKRNPLKVDLSSIAEEIELVDFSARLFNLQGKDSLQIWTELQNEYPDFFNLYTYKIIRIGGINDEHFPNLMKAFVNDTLIRNVQKKTNTIFSNKEELHKNLVKAFKYYNYHFPDKELPTIFTYISGFNQSVVTTEKSIGISLDKYLGRDYEYYQQLSTSPQYKRLNMHKEKILSDVAFAWGTTEFEHLNTTTNLLESMVQKGKLMYLIDAMLPDMEDSLKIGYTTQQLEWCKMNEAKMWTHLIEKKMLYSSKRMDIIRYINNAPSTSGFPTASPGRAGVWIGWQIVRKYMQKYPEKKLPELMSNADYQKILNDSGYNPK